MYYVQCIAGIKFGPLTLNFSITIFGLLALSAWSRPTLEDMLNNLVESPRLFHAFYVFDPTPRRQRVHGQVELVYEEAGPGVPLNGGQVPEGEVADVSPDGAVAGGERISSIPDGVSDADGTENQGRGSEVLDNIATKNTNKGFF